MIRVPFVTTGQIALLTCSVIFAVIPTIFVFLRLVARRIANRHLDAADYFILAAWVCCSRPSRGAIAWSWTRWLKKLQFVTVALAVVCSLGKF